MKLGEWHTLSTEECLRKTANADEMPLDRLMQAAMALRCEGHGRIQTWSPKVFIPLTKLCRNYCHYCTFSRPPDKGAPAYMSREEVLAIARRGAEAGCTEALFTLGDKPELRFEQARDELERLGNASTISYLGEMCAIVRDETGLLPHVNAGVMGREDLLALRRVSVSQGLMLESTSERLLDHGQAHYRSPDKAPDARIETIRLAGELNIPFTTGILIGIGETRRERIEAVLAIRDLHASYGHIQEVIVQNFRAKSNTPMHDAPEPDLSDLLWTISIARLLLGPSMNIQAPPNLSADTFPLLLRAGINDWGGVSPVTPDHVNPEAPWPALERLRAATNDEGLILERRLPVYPRYAQQNARWQDVKMTPYVVKSADTSGYGRNDGWSTGAAAPPPIQRPAKIAVEPSLRAIVARAEAGDDLSVAQVASLFEAREDDAAYLYQAADALRRETAGDAVTFVVNRNINYTNICTYKCGFCAFSKGSTDDRLRGPAYDLDISEVVRRATEAWDRGATEVCMQGGIHPRYTGETYLRLAKAIRAAAPQMHIHAFSPLEVSQGAETLGISVEEFLRELQAAGLNSLPGTAAEILDDEVRAIICPDKLTTQEWLDVVATAHRVGLRTTSTIMFGHVEGVRHWALHLLRVRRLQRETGGFTEFVPLPFVHMEAPMSLRGLSRRGPTFREARLMHAVARLALHPLITNIQASWTKLGQEGAKQCLMSGANDLGGTLMNESISRAAGAQHGQELPLHEMEKLIASIGRSPRQRSTLYGPVNTDRRASALNAAPLTPVVQTPPKHKSMRQPA